MSRAAAIVVLSALAALASGCKKQTTPPPPPDDRPKCATRANCAAGLICDASSHCAKCSYSRDCEPREVCSPVSKHCELKPGWGNDCTYNKECPLGQFCVQGLCKPGDQVTACVADKDCPVGQRCDQTNSVCEEDLGCFSDPECVATEYCNLAEHVCRPRCDAGNEAQLCAFGEHCANGRCVQCEADADCKPGLTCDVAAGKCEGQHLCFNDRDCPVPLICNGSTHECTVKPPPCLQDADCPAAQRCVVLTGQCVPATCLADRFAPNGTQAEAYPLPQPGSYGPATLCGGTEHDWFSLPLKAADRLQAVVDTDPLASQQFRIRLVDAGGHPLASGDVVLDRVVTADASYFLDLSTSDPQASYVLRLSVSHGDPCPEDVYDLAAWNGDYLHATLLDPGSFFNLAICAGDEDWYVLALPAGKTIGVAMTSDPFQGDLDLYLYDSDGKTELARSATANAIEQVAASGSSGGRVFVRVVGASQATQNYYDLKVTLP